jgi:serine/threonine protein kinase
VRSEFAQMVFHTTCACDLRCEVQDAVQLYIVTASSCKGDLAQFMANLGRTLTPVQAMKYVVKPLLLALASLHAQGLVHRDIKPENLLMSDSNTVMLCDFDLAIDSRGEVPVSQVRRSQSAQRHMCC